ncbi:hypothetical protein U0070_001697 [Myodes glareolus]|uniref:Uncharacterized protein n=1 Tax=Myodes glareolus TaxID=447135 RepID=A0AAW0JDV0_MYOGA
MEVVRERCLEEQKRRRQRATKKISTFIGTFLVCFAPYVITSSWASLVHLLTGLLRAGHISCSCAVRPVTVSYSPSQSAKSQAGLQFTAPGTRIPQTSLLQL